MSDGRCTLPLTSNEGALVEQINSKVWQIWKNCFFFFFFLLNVYWQIDLANKETSTFTATFEPTSKLAKNWNMKRCNGEVKESFFCSDFLFFFFFSRDESWKLHRLCRATVPLLSIIFTEIHLMTFWHHTPTSFCFIFSFSNFLLPWTCIQLQSNSLWGVSSSL